MTDSIHFDVGQSIKSASETWYKILQVLGTGGNSVTFLAFCTSGDSKGVSFAIKIFRKLSRDDRRESFLREVEFLQSCEHPSVMRIYDSGEFISKSALTEFRYPFVVAEYLPYRLYDVIRGNQASITEKLSHALQLISALRFLSNLTPQVVHRDIKPQNIFVKGRACVLGDFGLMKLLDQTVDDDLEFYKESVGPGMPFYYRTPDLISYAKGESEITTKSDVFQLGLVLAELFTGWNPAKRPADFLEPLELEPLGTISGGLGGLIAPPLNRMLTVDPEERPSADQIMDDWQGAFNVAAEKALELNGAVF